MKQFLFIFIVIVAVGGISGCGSSGSPEEKKLTVQFEQDAKGRFRRGYLGPGSIVRYNIELSIKIKETKKAGTLFGTAELVISEGPASPNGNRTIKASENTTFDRNAQEKLKTPVVFRSVRLIEVMPSGELITISAETTANGRFASKKYKVDQNLPAWIEENKTYSGYEIVIPDEKINWKADFEESRRISTKAGNFDCLLENAKRVGKNESYETTGYYCPLIDNYITYSERIITPRSDLESKCEIVSINIKPLR